MDSLNEGHLDLCISGATGLIGEVLLSKINTELMNVYCWDRNTDNDSLSRKLKNKKRVFIHLAGMSASSECEKDPSLSHESNVMLTKRIHDFCLKNNFNSLIFASTGLVYDQDAPRPFTEDSSLMPKGVYAKHKMESEQFLTGALSESAEGGLLHVVILRLSNVYSLRLKANTVLYDVFKQLKEGSPVIKIRTGSPRRDFIFAEDVAEAILSIVNKQLKENVSCYNLSSGKATSILELCQMIVACVDKNKVLIETEKNILDSSFFELDNSKFKKNFDWKPQNSLKAGVLKLVKANL